MHEEAVSPGATRYDESGTGGGYVTVRVEGGIAVGMRRMLSLHCHWLAPEKSRMGNTNTGSGGNQRANKLALSVN